MLLRETELAGGIFEMMNCLWGPGGRRGETAAPQLVSAVMSVPLIRDGRQKPLVQMVGVAGFEPATPSSRTRCATRLRYTPPAGRGSSMQMRRPARAWRHLRGGSSNVGINRVPTWLKAARSCGYVRGHKGRPRPDGASPSGKAGDFDSPMRRFESSRPSHIAISRGDVGKVRLLPHVLSNPRD